MRISRIRYALDRAVSIYWIVRADGILSSANVQRNDCILDVGCSSGQWTFSVAPQAKFVVGIDVELASVETATTLAARLGFENTSFVVASATALPFKDRTFDKIICADVLDIIPQDDKAAVELHRVAVLPAIAVFTNMVKDRKHYLFDHSFPEHIRNYTPEALKNLLEQASFQVVDSFHFYHPLSSILWEISFLFAHSRLSKLPGLGFFVGLILGSIARLDRRLSGPAGGIGIVAKRLN